MTHDELQELETTGFSRPQFISYTGPSLTSSLHPSFPQKPALTLALEESESDAPTGKGRHWCQVPLLVEVNINSLTPTRSLEHFCCLSADLSGQRYKRPHMVKKVRISGSFSYQ